MRDVLRLTRTAGATATASAAEELFKDVKGIMATAATATHPLLQPILAKTVIDLRKSTTTIHVSATDQGVAWLAQTAEQKASSCLHVGEDMSF
jgi:hypothetical protein